MIVRSSIVLGMAGCIGILALAGFLAVKSAAPAFSSPPPAMRLGPPTVKVSGGAQTVFSVDVVVDGAEDLGAIEFEISFDRQFVKLVDIEPGFFLGSTGRSVSCQEVTIGFNVEKLGCETEGGTPPGPSGSGTVATITFRVRGVGFGETLLQLENCGAANVLGVAILKNDCKDTQLTINTPTPTPIRNPRMQKLPDIQNLYLTRQDRKIPPTTCLNSTNMALFEERLSIPIPPMPNPKDPSQLQQLGAFEFEVRYDEKLVCIELTPGPAASAMICTILDDVTAPTIEGIARIGCVTQGKDVFPDTGTDAGRHLADVIVRPQPELYSQIRPNQGNGIVVQLLNQGCELSDLQGHPIKLTSCDDADVTVRYLEGDVEPDCLVDFFDMQSTAFRWGAHIGSLVYNQRYDVEPSGTVAGDGDIDIKDLQFVYGRFGSTCLNPHPLQPPVNAKGLLPTPSPTVAPTPTPTGTNNPRFNKAPTIRELPLTTPPPSKECGDASDAVTFEVQIKDPITSPDPKAPDQLQVLGGFELQVFYDPTLVCVDVSPGDIPNGEMSCFMQQGAIWVRFGCATLTKSNPAQPQPPGVIALITVRPQPAAYDQLPPGSGLEISTGLNNEFCQLTDLQGHDIKSTGCDDATVIIRAPP